MGKKTLCRCTALLIVSVLPVFQAIGADEGFIRDQNQCLARNRNPLPNERVTWTGGCKDGLADGVGVQQWYVNNEPGARYEGRMTKGVFDGHGKAVYRDGSTYEGEWRNGERQGKGMLVSAAGNKLEGTFVKGSPEGNVIATYPNGARYEGEWHNGVPDGKGLITSPTGEQAIIEYEKGKPKVFRRD